MTQVFKHSLLVVLLITLFASVCFAKEGDAVQKKPDGKIHLAIPTHRPKGLHVNVSTSVITFVGVDTKNTYDFNKLILPGKFDFVVGYQINPYVSIDARIETWLGYVSVVELSPKINLTNTRLSPFITGAIGMGASIISDNNDHSVMLYKVGAGLDFNATKHFSLFLSANLWGTNIKKETIIIPEAGIQLRF